MKPDVCEHIEEFEALSKDKILGLEEAISRQFLGMSETAKKSPNGSQEGARVLEGIGALRKGWLIESIAVDLAHCYAEGRGTKRDISKAIALLRPYEGQQDSSAAHVLASFQLFYSSRSPSRRKATRTSSRNSMMGQRMQLAS